MKKMRLLLSVFILCAAIHAQDTIIPLWPNGKIPNAMNSDEKEASFVQNGIQMYSKVQEPTISVYLPSKSNATGAAMLIFPGGGYHILAYDWEGTDIAKFLNGKGIAGIVVKYRLPSSDSQLNKHQVPLIDAQRAMRLVRSKASYFNIDRTKIGIVGFSAGGHLASTLGTHFSEKVYQPLDAIDTLSARPDFMALGYPVISMGTIGHSGSKHALLGAHPSQELMTHFSNEKQVTANTPPTFLFHAMDDEGVDVQNSILFFQALKEAGVSTTMHIYPRGGHGFSLARNDRHLRGWTERLFEWMEALEHD